MAPISTVTFGSHVATREAGSGLIVLRARGAVSLDDVKLFMATCKTWVPRKGLLLMLLDNREASALGPEARKVITDAHRDQEWKSIAALLVASTMQRILFSIATTAVRLTASDAETALFNDEPSARQWLEQRRDQYLRAAAAAG